MNFILPAKKHFLESHKLAKKVRIAQLSDLHFNEFTPEEKMINLLNRTNECKPDYVIICGDLVFGRPENNDILIEFLTRLAAYVPVYITLGNHDLMKLAFDSNSFKYKWVEYNHQELLETIKIIQGVKILENETIYLNDYNLSITGIDPGFKHYEKSKENSLDFEGCVNAVHTQELPKEVYNTISCHSPLGLLNHNNLNNIVIFRNADLTHCGHTHNGGVPIFFEPLFKVIGRGLIDPHGNVFPKYVLGGEYNRGDNKIIVGGPITFLAKTKNPTLVKSIVTTVSNMVIPPRIDIIEAKPGMSKKLKRN